jgi:two-component system LytT family sensor kinase
LAAASITILPKLLAAYFIIYEVLEKFLRQQLTLWSMIFQVVLVMIIAVVIYRLIFNYIILPVLYHGLIKSRPLFNTLGVLLAIMDIGFVTGIAIAIKLLSIQLSGKEREKELIKDKLETELKFLRQQTSPHFLFNTLNNIYALARKKADNTAEVVMKLSTLLRFMLYESKKDLISISEELRILDDYIELEKIRYDERFTISFQREIDEPNQKIAPLLLLPFIENAFKHGVSESRFNSFIHIEMKLKEEHLFFCVENSTENNHHEIIDGIGLSSVRRQLELMYREYKLHFENENDIFKAHLNINLNSHAKI